MKDFLIDLFDYHHLLNQKLADLFIENSDRVSEKSIFLFIHSQTAQQIWNARILDNENFELHENYGLEKFKEIDRSNYSESLKILNEFDLAKKIHYRNSKGIEFENSVQEILFHAANHFSHHRGQIISDLRSCGIEPIITDYIYYKR